MGKVVYATGIDYVSGSLSKPKKVNGHNCGSYLIGTHRTAPSESEACTRLYVRKADTYVRTTPSTAKENAAKARFSIVSAAVAARMKDLSKITQDQIDFIAQKNEPGGRKTMKSYLWKVEGDAYDDEHEG